jgi:hypothetical protein
MKPLLGFPTVHKLYVYLTFHFVKFINFPGHSVPQVFAFKESGEPSSASMNKMLFKEVMSKAPHFMYLELL